AYLPYPAHPHPKNVRKPLFFQLGQGPGTDHAPVCDHTELPDAKPATDALGYRHERGNIRGIPGHHLTAHRSPGVIDYRTNHLLLEVAARILAVSVLAQSVSSFTLEVDARGVEEHQVHAGEQISIGREDPLFDKVLDTPGSTGQAALLVLELLSQECHGPIEVVKAQILSAGDETVPSPAITGAIRARSEQTMQHGHEDGPFHI